MKFIHIADMHFDTPFTTLTSKSNLGNIRRIDQRNAFQKLIDYIKVEQIPYLFISGDLYEHKYIRKSTIEFINNKFKQIPNTQIFISPGNHDPYLQNSFYNKFIWNDNVHIFNSKLSVYETPETDIYGVGFDDFYCSNLQIENIKIKNPNKLNILITHGTLNGSTATQRDYNPISKKSLEDIGFDYVALGHIHKLDYNSERNQHIVYPGSTVSMGFDELGKHGMILGNLDKNSISLNFIPLDSKEFIIYELDTTNILDLEELAEKINSLEISNDNFYKISLIGKRNFEININTLFKMISKPNIIKIKNYTKMNYDIEKVSNENTLKGLFVKEILTQLSSNPDNKDLLEQALEFGLESLDANKNSII